MKSKILKMLLDAHDYVSGQKICEELGVSRTAIWKVMNQLKEEGYQIESVTNKGYRIVSCPDLVTKEAIEGKIKTSVLGKQVIYRDETESTNTLAKQYAEKPDSHGLLVIADVQSSGKGRRGRSWISPGGCGIWMSLILKPDFEPYCASMLTLISALSVARAIEDNTGLEAKIKWPNDIVVHGKKVCGILTEMNAEVDYINYVIVGIGINVNTMEFPEEIQSMATSLAVELGHKADRSQLICDSMKYFESYYGQFLLNRNMSPFMKEYNSYLININKTVKIIGKQEVTGIALGINEKGELLVEVDGTVVPVLSGEVSVRGLYGYV